MWAMSVVMGHEAIGCAYNQLSTGVNGSRGKQIIVRTMTPSVELFEERKKEAVVKHGGVPPSHLPVGVITHPRVVNRTKEMALSTDEASKSTSLVELAPD
jgi:hypothetical protein